MASREGAFLEHGHHWRAGLALKKLVNSVAAAGPPVEEMWIKTTENAQANPVVRRWEYGYTEGSRSTPVISGPKQIDVVQDSPKMSSLCKAWDSQLG